MINRANSGLSLKCIGNVYNVLILDFLFTVQEIIEYKL
jgi:hypothetical protein